MTAALYVPTVVNGLGISSREAPPANNPPTYDPRLDAERLGKQLGAVLVIMSGGAWMTLAEISAAIDEAYLGEIHAPEASVSARLRDMRNKLGWLVHRRRRGDPKRGLWEYRAQRGVS